MKTCNGCIHERLKDMAWGSSQPHPCAGCSRVIQDSVDKYQPINKPTQTVAGNQGSQETNCFICASSYWCGCKGSMGGKTYCSAFKPIEKCTCKEPHLQYPYKICSDCGREVDCSLFRAIVEKCSVCNDSHLIATKPIVSLCPKCEKGEKCPTS